ncbi:hypothetical protein C8J56DRAFT_985339 [Mycena floridula]|nr:hypothetical protein C8J56DRAFT_985339 [Mycena floridula]
MHCPCPNCGCGLNDRQFNLDSIDSERSITTTARRIESLLTSNEPPLESERDHLSSVLSQNQIDLSDMDFQISRTRGALETLEVCRATTDKTISKFEAVLSPIRILPNDVLCEIFGSCVEDVSVSRLLRGHRLNQAPWTLTYICDRWRAVTLSYPHIWSEITVQLAEQNQDRLAKVIGCQLRRSGTQLLSIRLHYGPDVPTYSSIINLLFAHSSRWKSLNFHSSQSVKADIFDELVGFLSSLRTLTLNGDSVIHSAFRTAPNLMSVTGNTAALRCAPRYITEYSSSTRLSIRDTIIALSDYRLLTKCTLLLTVPTGLPNSSLSLPNWRTCR